MSKPNLDHFIPVPGRNQILAKHKFEFDEVIVPGMNPIRIPKYMIFPASIWNNLPVVSIEGKEYPKAGYVQTSREVEIAPDPPEAKKAAAQDTVSASKDDESAIKDSSVIGRVSVPTTGKFHPLESNWKLYRRFALKFNSPAPAITDVTEDPK